jgi:hypothetical protein
MSFIVSFSLFSVLVPSLARFVRNKYFCSKVLTSNTLGHGGHAFFSRASNGFTVGTKGQGTPAVTIF